MRAKVATLIAVVGAGLVCAAVLYSQDQGTTGNMNQPENQQAQYVRVRDLLGSQVINPESQDLGKIEDAVINTDTGKIRYGIVGYGGVMGVGTKYLAAPWSALDWCSKARRHPPVQPPRRTTSCSTLRETP